MHGNGWHNVYPHDEPKNFELFHEKRDAYVLRGRRKYRMIIQRNERVALFIAYERETAQGRRGRLLECAHIVCFPLACVGSEKIAKYL